MKEIALGALTALLLTGCGLGSSTPQAIDGNDIANAAYADDGVFYRMGGGNFPTETTPAGVASREENVVLGTVDGFEDGQTESFTYSDGTTEVDRYVVIRVKVREVLKGDSDSFKSGYAFLTRPRGVQTLDAKGDLVTGGDAAIPVDEFGKSIPTGARVLAMASPFRPKADQRIKVESPRAGVSDPSAPILLVYDPQTLLMDGGPESALRGWQGDQKFTFDSALADVRTAVSAK
ncbi:hypothetical protein [Nocardioides marmoriginsengisoli]|uniref:hypothetical protein n=1 Tax=Nocardioides marmoriginsengisoli TaxID=661483 RepID=UPI0011CEA093|nr:hypothetical protein [Nocardioides marmoriginsengisoli]